MYRKKCEKSSKDKNTEIMCQKNDWLIKNWCSKVMDSAELWLQDTEIFESVYSRLRCLNIRRKFRIKNLTRIGSALELLCMDPWVEN